MLVVRIALAGWVFELDFGRPEQHEVVHNNELETELAFGFVAPDDEEV
ncbi:hypothetical protein ACIA8K_12700 [Catenuloplanes sp. NPDC051500]